MTSCSPPRRATLCTTRPAASTTPSAAPCRLDRLGRVRQFQYDALGRNTAEIWYADETDADYRLVRGLVEDAVKKAWSFPRRDLLGLLPPADTAEARVVAGQVGK